MQLRQPWFAYSVFVHLLRIKKKQKKIKETEESRYIYQNELGKACFQHDLVYGDFKDLNRRTFADKILLDKAFNITKDPKYDGYQRGLLLTVYKFLVKKGLVVASKMKIFLIKNYRKSYQNQLLETLIKEQYTHLL